MLKIDPKKVSTPELHGYLLSAVAPRPIALASTMDANGRPNLSPFSFFNVFSANPPIAVFSPARRVRGNTTKHTLENAEATKEVVINVVDYSMVQQMSLSSTEYDEGVNEFIKSGFTSVPSEVVKPFRVKESPVQLECKVVDIIKLGTEGGAGNMIVCEIVMVHVSDKVLNEENKIDPLKMDQVARCGGNWYSRANSSSMFEVPKPIRNLGIGVDQIPEDIKMSKILTGNDLGMLGNIEALPNETDVNDYKLLDLPELFIELEDQPNKLEEELHKLAHSKLEQGLVEEAWKILLTFNN